MLAALGVLLATAAVAAPLSTDPSRPRLQLRIDVEPGVALDAADLRAIASEVRAIWAPVLDVAVTIGPSSSRLVAVDSIVLVITNRTLDTSETTGLGWTEFVDGVPQPSITVSMGAARRLLEAGQWRGFQFAVLPPRASRMFLQRAVARASAHEVGHYLLRSRNHSRKGLMRAVFTVDEIMDTRRSLDRLEPDAAERLRSHPAVARAQDE